MSAISLFSGAGGDSLGLEQAGLDVVAFSEFNADAVKTHQAAFPESVWLGSSVKGNITKIPDTEFEPYRGKIKVVFAGFPCQGFSNAGKKDENDPRNKMFYQFLRVVKTVQPDWVMGENVAGLLTRKTDDGKTKVIDVIKAEFANIGYSLTCKVYDVSTAGVSQSRKRLFMIGNKIGIPFKMPEFAVPKQGIRQYIEPTLDGAIQTTLLPPSECVFEIPELVPTGTPHPYLMLKHPELISFGKRVSAHHSEVLDLDKPCKTIICAYTFQPRLYVCLQTPSKKNFIRCLTLRELAQIQGFPRAHPFKGSTTSVIKQIGNAVPAKIIEMLTTSILETEEPN
jgi:DNA (cytosine-5)-methyltransferase 1